MKRNKDMKPLRTVADYREALKKEKAGLGRLTSPELYGVDYFLPKGQREDPLPAIMVELAEPFRRLGRDPDGLHSGNVTYVLKLMGQLESAFDPGKPILPSPLRNHSMWERLLDDCPTVFGVLVRYIAVESAKSDTRQRLALVQEIDDQLKELCTKWECIDTVRRCASHPNLVGWGDMKVEGATAKNRNWFRLSKKYAQFREFATHKDALFPEELKLEIARACEEIEQFLDNEYLQLHLGPGDIFLVRFYDVKLAGKYVHMLRPDLTRKDRAKAVSNAVGLQIWDELWALDREKARFFNNELDYLVYSMMHVLFPAQHKDFPDPEWQKMFSDRVRRTRHREHKRAPKQPPPRQST